MTAPDDDFGSLFEFLPIGAYRTSPAGRQMRANPALVALNGYTSEAEMLAAVQDLGTEWYVQPGRRDEFKRRLEAEGRVIAFESEIYRHRTRERIWISENAHAVRDADGRVRYYEGTVEEITDRVIARQALRQSQEELRQIVELVPGMVYRVVLLPDGRRRATFVSPGIREIYGVEPAAALADGDLINRLRHPDDQPRIEAETAAAARALAPMRTEFRVLRPDGLVKWVHVISAPAPDDDEGHPVRVGAVFDISDRKRAEEALQRSEQRLQQLVSLIPGVVYRLVIRPDGTRRYSFVSDHVRELYGLEPAEVLADGEALARLRHPDDAPVLQKLAETAIRERRALRYEVRVRLRDGREKWVQATSTPAPPEDGNEVRVGLLFDVTEYKRAEALRIERDRAAANDLAKSQFLSRVSHELRTPLNAILGFAQLLELDPGGGARQQGWVQQVLSSGRHLLALMDDILDISSAQTGQLPVSVEAVPLRPALDEVFALVAGMAHDAGVTIVDTLPPGLVLRADRKRLKQIVSNLLSNAIKYNRRGGRVQLDANRLGEAVEIAVTDDGPGLDATQLARLFQPFERVGAQHGPVAGTGLGLALSRQLAEAMGGSLVAESEAGRGATFRLRLPVD